MQEIHKTIRKYDFIASEVKNEGGNWLKFCNHGYGGNPLLPYNEDEMIFKNQCNLYVHLFEEFDIQINERSILDIGSGFGAGTNILKKYYSVKNLTGIDISPITFNIAKTNFPDINFIYFNALNLNQLGKNFDIIISVETLHHYCREKHHYFQLYETLTNNGELLITTILKTKYFEEIKNNFVEAGFKIKEIKNITNKVIGAIEEDIIKIPSVFSDKVNKKYVNRHIENLIYKKQTYESGKNSYYTFYVQK